MNVLYALVHYGIDGGISVLAFIGVLEITVWANSGRIPDLTFEFPDE